MFLPFHASKCWKVTYNFSEKSTAGDQANVQCSCAPIGPGGSAVLDGPEPKLKDFYGTPIQANTTLTERLRYPLPKPNVFEIPTEGLLLC